VGRTARAGRSGKSITIVTQYDVEWILRIEHAIGKKMELWPTEKEEVLLLKERVGEACRLAANEMKEDKREKGRGRKRKHNDGAGEDNRDREDDMVSAEFPDKKSKHGRRR
jgi:ATP-dependent RNA helicase DDX47/RRP3